MLPRSVYHGTAHLWPLAELFRRIRASGFPTKPFKNAMSFYVGRNKGRQFFPKISKGFIFHHNTLQTPPLFPILAGRMPQPLENVVVEQTR